MKTTDEMWEAEGREYEKELREKEYQQSCQILSDLMAHMCAKELRAFYRGQQEMRERCAKKAAEILGEGQVSIAIGEIDVEKEY